jgi:hypothetical protein
MTRYGRRVNGAHPTVPPESSNDRNAPTPRWVKLFGAALVVLSVALVGMLIGGGHGPGAHLHARPPSGPS